MESNRIPIAERGKLILEAKRQKVDALRMAQQEQLRILSASAVPLITKKSMGLVRGVDDMLNWETARRQKLIAQQQQMADETEKQYTGKPVLFTSKSPFIPQSHLTGDFVDGSGDEVASVSSHSYSSGSVRVQDRLTEYGERQVGL